MIKEKFIKDVLDTVTEGRSLPTEPNYKAINIIIKNGLRWFKEKVDETTEHEYIIIKQSNFATDLFRNKRKVQLPPCVEAIDDLEEARSNLALGNAMSKNYSDTNFYRHVAASGTPEDMLYSVVANYYNEFIQNQFVLRTVSYDYNPHTHMLVIKGRDPRCDLIASAYVHIADESIYNMDLFHRYIAAKFKISFANVIGFTNSKLIGGTDINSTEMKRDGNDELKDVKDDIKNDMSADFIQFF